MSKKSGIILVGGGGHCRSCIDVIEEQGLFNIIGIVDTKSRIGEKLEGYEIIAEDRDLPTLIKEHKKYLITIGQIKNSNIRIELYKKIITLGGSFPVIISPLAHVSKSAHIGYGTIVMHHALINRNASIGNNCIINTKALVEHDAQIGNNCHLATSSVVNGGVSIGDDTFIGSNSVCRESITIGENVVIGSGVNVYKDINTNSFIKKLP